MNKRFALIFLMSFSALCFGANETFAAVRKSVANVPVSGGTKISAGVENTLVNPECQESYFSCMDALCMLENVSGGRCQCSNKHKTLMETLDELLKKDEMAVNISEYGADFVKSDMSEAAEIAKKNIEKKPKANETKQSNSLSREDWDKMFSVDDDEDEEETFVMDDDISDKTGDALYNESESMCWAQLPDKCASDEEMLKMLYVQKIKSDCVAFENSIKQQTIEINAKLADAEKTVRAAALEEFQSANKYGLGQCEKEFKSCMQTTAGCNKDFTGCVTLSANENVMNQSNKIVLSGSLVDAKISASTMDNLNSKKILCESVLESCVKVRDNVWDMFLQDIAMTLSNAEEKAESNLRESCLGTISECYIKACREHFDPEDDAGTYDMCLSRPENYKSFCKIELEPCLAATGGSYENPSKSRLWNGVMSKLAAMRSDACNKEFKECLESDDRCGSDYSKCIGLDTDDVALLCPDDKLPACYKEYEGKTETVRETLANVAQLILLQVDSGLTNACQNAVQDAMLKICGSQEHCDEIVVNQGAGSRSLELKFCEIEDDEDKYANCKDSLDSISDKELGKTMRNADLSKTKNARHIYAPVILGRIYWDQITPLPDYSGVISVDEYMKKIEGAEYMDEKSKEKVRTEVGALINMINTAVSSLDSDPKVQFCTTGRKVQGLTMDNGFEQVIGKETAVYPNISLESRMLIIESSLRAAQENYNKKYESLYKDALDANEILDKRYAEIDGANLHLGEQDTARKKCIALGENGAISDKKGGGSAKTKIVRNKGNDDKLVGYSSESTYKFKRQVTTSFDMTSMVCTKCTRTQDCEKTKNSYCKKWGDEQESCEYIQY